jgi:hypothetical protein
LPDFFETIYQNGENIPNKKGLNGQKIFPVSEKIIQMPMKYTNIFHSTALQNLPKLGFLV